MDQLLRVCIAHYVRNAANYKRTLKNTISFLFEENKIYGCSRDRIVKPDTFLNSAKQTCASLELKIIYFKNGKFFLFVFSLKNRIFRKYFFRRFTSQIHRHQMSLKASGMTRVTVQVMTHFRSLIYLFKPLRCLFRPLVDLWDACSHLWNSCRSVMDT